MALSRASRQYLGVRAILPPDLQTATRAPTSSDRAYVKGTLWLDTDAGSAYMWPGTGDWISLGSGTTGAIVTLTGDSGGAISPVGGNIDILGTAGEIEVIGTAGTLTVSLPTALVAPGSIVATTTLEATTTLTVGTGATISDGGLLVSGGDIINSHSDAGTDVTIEVTNSDNTDAASRAGLEIAVGGASGGDPYLSFQISGVAASTMTMGLDNSASDLFVISNSTALGTANAMTLSQAGAFNATTSVTAGTTITATLGAITATNGNLVLGTAGNKLIIPTGANASVGTSSAMSGTPGEVVVATTACSATAKVFYSRATTGGTPGQVSITAQDGTGFTLTSTGNETSTFNWWIINA